MSDDPSSTLRCDIDRAHAHLAAPLLRSFVHHHCTVVDCDVATADVLETAVAEVIETVENRLGSVIRIEMRPDTRDVDIWLSIARPSASSSTSVVRGPVATAAALYATVERDGRVRLQHRFAGGRRP